MLHPQLVKDGLGVVVGGADHGGVALDLLGQLPGLEDEPLGDPPAPVVRVHPEGEHLVDPAYLRALLEHLRRPHAVDEDVYEHRVLRGEAGEELLLRRARDGQLRSACSVLRFVSTKSGKTCARLVFTHLSMT